MDYFKIEKSCSQKTLTQLYKIISKLKVFDGFKPVANIEEIRNINEILVYWINIKKGKTDSLMVHDHVLKMQDLYENNEFLHHQYTIDELMQNNDYSKNGVVIKDLFR